PLFEEFLYENLVTGAVLAQRRGRAVVLEVVHDVVGEIAVEGRNAGRAIDNFVGHAGGEIGAIIHAAIRVDGVFEQIAQPTADVFDGFKANGTDERAEVFAANGFAGDADERPIDCGSAVGMSPGPAETIDLAIDPAIVLVADVFLANLVR